MTRAWLAAVLIALGIVAARAIPAEQQIIIFGGLASSASGGSGCTPTGLKFNAACNSQYATVIHF